MNNLTCKIFLYSIFLILSLIVYPYPAFAQKSNTVSLREKNTSISTILNKIEKETGYSMAYNRSKLKLDEQISITLNNVKINKALDQIFKDTDYSYKIKGYHVIIVRNEKKEEIPVEPEKKEVIILPPIEYDFSQNIHIDTEIYKPISAQTNIRPINIPSPPKEEKEPFLLIKNNILYDIIAVNSLNLNLGAELKLSDKYTLDILASYNPWTFGDNKKMKHILIQPELRYWLGKSFSGHFMGVHAHWAMFNIGNTSFLAKIEDRYQGSLFGGGFSYGYKWALNAKWSMEATAGLGYANVNYKRYDYPVCGEFIEKKQKNYIGVTKIGLTISYTLK